MLDKEVQSKVWQNVQAEKRFARVQQARRDIARWIGPANHGGEAPVGESFRVIREIEAAACVAQHEAGAVPHRRQESPIE